MRVEIARSFERDWRKIKDQAIRDRVNDAIEALKTGQPGLDVTPLARHPGWFRLRIGDYRVLYTMQTQQTWILSRIVPRGQLAQAVNKL